MSHTNRSDEIGFEPISSFSQPGISQSTFRFLFDAAPQDQQGRNTMSTTTAGSAGDTLRFRYAHVRPDGETATGRCESTIETLADGRLRLHETWAWESREGTGTSVVEEVL